MINFQTKGILLLTLILSGCSHWKNISCNQCQLVYGDVIDGSAGTLAKGATVNFKWRAEGIDKSNGMLVFSPSASQSIGEVKTDENGRYYLFFNPKDKMLGGEYFMRVTYKTNTWYAQEVEYSSEKVQKIDFEISDETKYPPGKLFPKKH